MNQTLAHLLKSYAQRTFIFLRGIDQPRPVASRANTPWSSRHKKDSVMRILVVGAGAVGGYFGGRLAQAGRDVTSVRSAPRPSVQQGCSLSAHTAISPFIPRQSLQPKSHSRMTVFFSRDISSIPAVSRPSVV